MGGRVADIEGVPGDPNTVYVATGSGGIFKTTNGGIDWTPIFDRQNSISVGDIALEPGNPDVIWVGTGESNVRNSVSFGDGVYKSTDGGKTLETSRFEGYEHDLENRYQSEKSRHRLCRGSRSRVGTKRRTRRFYDDRRRRNVEENSLY